MRAENSCVRTRAFRPYVETNGYHKNMEWINKIFFCTVLLTTLSSLTACSQTSSPVSNDSVNVTVAFTSVNVVSMTFEGVLENQSVVVQEGKIREIGPQDSISIPIEAEIIDGQGGYLLPGLTDFHIHLRSTDELISYLAYGVTSVVHLSGANRGAPDLLRYREELQSGKMLGPALFATGSMLDGNPPIFPRVSTVVTTSEEARKAVLEQKQAGFDFIKVYNNLAPEVLETVVETAHELDMAVVGHIPRGGGRDRALQLALSAGQDMIAHGEEYFFTYFHSDVDSLLDRGEIPYPDTSKIPSAVQWTKEAGTVVTPNLSFVAMTRRQLDNMDAVLADPEARYLHPDVLRMWETQNPTHRPNLERFDRREQARYVFLQQLTKALSDASVPLLLGTDASVSGLFPGKSAHVELIELVKAGLTPYQALLTGTRNSGIFINDYVPGSEPFGLVAPGYRADLLLVAENPLENINNISSVMGVMAKGRWLSSATLKSIRNELADSYDE